MSENASNADPAAHHGGTSQHAIARDVTVQVLGRFVNLILGLFVTILVARLLGDARFGEWATLAAILILGGAICDLGFTQVAVRRAAEDPPREPEWLGALLQLRFALSLLALGLSSVAVVLISTSGEMRTAGIVLVLTLLPSVSAGLKAIFQLRVRNDFLVLIMSVQSVLWALAAVVVFYLEGGLVALAVGFAISIVLVDVLQTVLALRLGSVRLRGVGHRWPELVRVGVPVAIGSVLILSYGRIDQILVLELAGATDAGLYGAAYRLFDQAQFVAISVATTVFPLLAASYRTNPARFRSLLQAATEVMLAPMIGGFVLTLLFAEDLVVLLFGSEFAAAADALPVLVGALIPVSLGYLLGSLVILTEAQRPFVVVAAAGLGFNVALNVLLIPRWGFVAAAWVTLVTEVLVLGLAGALVSHRLTMPLRLGRIPGILSAAAATFIVLLALRALSAPVGVAIAATAIVYPAAMLALRTVHVDELRTLWRAAGGTA